MFEVSMKDRLMYVRDRTYHVKSDTNTSAQLPSLT